MNRLESLIELRCPNGVAHKPLRTVIQLERGVRVTKSELTPEGKYPVVSGGTGYMGYLDKFNRKPGSITIAQYGTAGYVKWQVEKFWANDVCYTVVANNEEVLDRFIYFLLASKQSLLYKISNRNAVPFSIDREKILDIKVPVPPLEVQKEIIRILDTFEELDGELKAELAARKKQYEHHRKALLTLDDENLQWVPMGEVLDFKQPGPYLVDTKEYSNDFDVPVLTAGQTFILGYTDEKEGIYEASKNSPTIIFDDFTTANQWVDFPFKAKSSAMKMLIPKTDLLILRFAYFYLQTLNFKPKEHARHWIGTFSKKLMPLPSLSDQMKIVEIFDRYDELVNDNTTGIPAEIKSRRKQYEYYRDKLLTFKEHVA